MSVHRPSSIVYRLVLSSWFSVLIVVTTHTLFSKSSRALLWPGAALLLAVFIATVPLPLLPRLVALGVAIVLPLLDPVFGVYMAVLSVPVQDVARLPGGLSYTQAAVLWAAAVWLLRVLAHPERRVVFGWAFWLWAVLLWALLLSTALTPYSQSVAFKETSRWFVAFTVWLIAVNTVRQRWQIIGLLACLLAAPAAEALVGLVQFYYGYGPPSFRITPGLPYVRAYGTIGTPNPFAGYLNMGWPLALALAVYVTRRAMDERRTTNDERQNINVYRLSSIVCAWSIAVLLLGALVASFSRGGWLGAVAGVAGMALALGRRAAQLVLIGGALGLLLLALGGAGLLPAALSARMASVTNSVVLVDPRSVPVTPQNFSVVERMAQMWAGARMFALHPLTGVGPGNYTLAYADVTAPPWYVSRGHAHNYYIHMAAEAGVIGLLAYLTWLGGMVRLAWVNTRRAQGLFWRSVGVGCCGVVAAVAGHNLFENLHVLNMGIQLAAVFALVVVLPRAEHELLPQRSQRTQRVSF